MLCCSGSALFSGRDIPELQGRAIDTLVTSHVLGVIDSEKLWDVGCGNEGRKVEGILKEERVDHV